MDGVDRSTRGERPHPVHHADCRNRGRCEHYPGGSNSRAECAAPVCDEKRRRCVADKCSSGANRSRDYAAAAAIRGNTVTVTALIFRSVKCCRVTGSAQEQSGPRVFRENVQNRGNAIIMTIEARFDRPAPSAPSERHRHFDVSEGEECFCRPWCNGLSFYPRTP